jgi:hypothetical protein
MTSAPNWGARMSMADSRVVTRGSSQYRPLTERAPDLLKRRSGARLHVRRVRDTCGKAVPSCGKAARSALARRAEA